MHCAALANEYRLILSTAWALWLFSFANPLSRSPMTSCKNGARSVSEESNLNTATTCETFCTLSDGEKRLAPLFGAIVSSVAATQGLAEDCARGAPYWMPIGGPNRTPIDTIRCSRGSPTSRGILPDTVRLFGAKLPEVEVS